MPIAATMTLEVIGLVPGNVFRRAHAGSSCTNLVLSVDKPSMQLIKPAPVPGPILDDTDHAEQQHVRALGKDAGQFGVQEAQPARPEGTNWPKASKASHYRPSRAAPLCKSLLAGDPIIGNIRFTSHERGRPQLSRSAARRQQAFPRRRNRTQPSTHREYPIPVFGPSAGRVCRDKSHFISP